MTTTVVALGPNLRGKRHGACEVHAAGCADLRKAINRGAEGADYPMDVESRREVVEFVYPPDCFDWDDPDDRAYWDDVWFAPCLSALPR